MATIVFKDAKISVETYLKDGIPMLYVDEIFMLCKLPLHNLVEFNNRYKTDNRCPADGDPEDRGYYVGAELYDVHEYLVSLRPGVFQHLLKKLQKSLLRVVSGYWINVVYDQDFPPVLTINPGIPSEADVKFVEEAATSLTNLLKVYAKEFDHMELFTASILRARQVTYGPNLLINILMWYIPRTADGAIVLCRVRELVWAIQKTNQSESSLFAIQWAIADLLSLDEGAYEDWDLIEVHLFTGILMVLREYTNGY